MTRIIVNATTGETSTSPIDPPAQSAEARINEWRQTARLSRADFCVALKRAGILPAQEAVLAAKGEWPATFDAALSSFPDVDEAKIIWAAVAVIERLHPMLLALQSFAGLTDAQVDALFGWS